MIKRNKYPLISKNVYKKYNKISPILRIEIFFPKKEDLTILIGMLKTISSIIDNNGKPTQLLLESRITAIQYTRAKPFVRLPTVLLSKGSYRLGSSISLVDKSGIRMKGTPGESTVTCDATDISNLFNMGPPLSLDRWVVFEGIIINGCGQILDGIRWKNVKFVNMTVKYLGGDLSLDNVEFINSKLQEPESDRGTQLRNCFAESSCNINFRGL